METLKKVQHFIESNQLLGERQRVLAGISGGADSVVMLNILQKLGFECVVAHCNFHLRGKESDTDEEFVENLAKKYQLTFKKIDFNTVSFAKANKISIEMAARELRYSWFEKTKTELNCQAIAVAHHSDDSVETVLMNLIRGTGLKGLTGIEAKNGHIVRPLLCCTRSEIEVYAQKNKLEFVTDSTNSTTDYMRNKIRNSILPMLAEINPSVKNTIIENSQRLKGNYQIYLEKINEINSEITSIKDDLLYIDIEKLKKYSQRETILYEILHPYNFNSDVIKNISKSLEKSSGVRFLSPSHRLLKDRNHLIISELEKKNTLEFTIDENEKLIEFPIHLELTKLKNENNFQFSKAADTIHIDYDKLKFPLTLRKWQSGDIFFPFGMNKKKKLSDFFIDEKINLYQKENVWILLSDNQIVWIIGLRLDNRYRITKSTKNIAQITFVR